MNFKTGVSRKQSMPNFLKKQIFLTPWYAQGVRNVFSENLVSFVFLKHPLWNSPFCIITNLIMFWKVTIFCNTSFELCPLFLHCIKYRNFTLFSGVEFCGNAQFLQSLRQISRNCMETVHLHKMSIPRN